LERLVEKLERVPEWDDWALVFLGDFVDRGGDVPGTIGLVLELLGRRAGGSAVLGTMISSWCVPFASTTVRARSIEAKAT
jgi:hypothetical protein